MSKAGDRARVARHEIREELERRILSGQTKPGQRLSQQSLARELGVAQGTVRESLLELQWLGLVESIDRLGVFVDRLDVSRISEAYQLREVLEGLAARLACRHAGRTDLAELRGMVDEIHRLAEQDERVETALLDRKFHQRIAELARNETLLRLAQAYRALGMPVGALRDSATIREEHLAIVQAMDDNAENEAERLAREHVMIARETLEQCAREGTFVPQWAR